MIQMSAEPRQKECNDGFAPALVLVSGETSQTLCRIAVLLDTLHCGAMLMDRDGRLAHVNRRLCEMMQRDCDELIGQQVVDLYPAGVGRDIVQNILEHFDDAREQESYLLRRDGTELPVIISGRRLDGEAPLGDHRIVTIIDISQQKKAERDLQETSQNIARLSDTAMAQALELKSYSHRLEERVHERTLELHEANMEAIYMLAVASDTKDLDTGAHVRRIEHYTRLLALELGLSAKEAEHMAYSSILHDVGKIQVPDEILRKPAALSEDEWKIMRQHTIAGERILSRKPFFNLARAIARSHHENWDGSGYPDGLKTTKIPLAARIVHVVDVYDALTSIRPYKQAWSSATATSEIEQKQEQYFDPEIVRAFLQLSRTNRLIAPEVSV